MKHIAIAITVTTTAWALAAGCSTTTADGGSHTDFQCQVDADCDLGPCNEGVCREELDAALAAAACDGDEDCEQGGCTDGVCVADWKARDTVRGDGGASQPDGGGASGGSGGRGSAEGPEAGPGVEACDGPGGCAEGACEFDPASGCGACVAVEVGDPCVAVVVGAGTSIDCGPALICDVQTMTCQALIALGEPCDRDAPINPCEPGAYCEQRDTDAEGFCYEALTEEFAPCAGAGNRSSQKGCDIRLGLVCVETFIASAAAPGGVDVQSQCRRTEDLVVGLGQACPMLLSPGPGDVGDTLTRICEPGTACSNDGQTGTGEGTCVTVGSIGESCDAVVGCESGAVCRDGTCEAVVCQ